MSQQTVITNLSDEELSEALDDALANGLSDLVWILINELERRDAAVTL